MKPKATKCLSLMLAGALQILPMVRSALPGLQALASSPTGALILRWAAGGVAFFGYHAISSASSIAISPATAIIGVPYNGTITYSGSHSGSVSAMVMSNVCLGSHTLVPGLTVTYTGGYTAQVTGTPTGNLGTFPFAITVWEFGCNSGLADTRSASLIVQNTNGSAVAPSITAAPQSVTAQVGADILLSGGATGNPPPAYYWKQGLNFIPGATNNTFHLSAAAFTNSGAYTLEASNSQGTAVSACDVSVALTPGSNILAVDFTNYWLASSAVTMNSYITNVPAATNTYDWQYNYTSIGVTTSNLSLTSAQTTPAKSGIYTIQFVSKVGTNTIVNQSYDSYWMFGYLPVITNQPTPVSVGVGSNATFTCTLAGGNLPCICLYQNGTNLVAQTNLLNYNPGGYGSNGVLQSGNASTTTNISLTVSNVSAASAGNYTFVIWNFWGSTTSSPAALTVTSPISVSSPAGQTNYAGKTVSLSVTPSGTAPFSYQWQKGSNNLSNGGNISGATTNTLIFNPAMVSNSGNYQVIVTNTSGSVTSTVASVLIVPVPSLGLSLGANSVALSASGGVAGSNYVVQVSTNLANPNGWTSLHTNSVPVNGNITYTDTNAPTNAQRYYRVQFP